MLLALCTSNTQQLDGDVWEKEIPAGNSAWAVCREQQSQAGSAYTTSRKMLQHELIFIKKVRGTAGGQTESLCRWKGQWEEGTSRKNAANWCFGEKANAFTLTAVGGFCLLQAVCGSSWLWGLLVWVGFST